jgi:hypothetical protein
VYKHITGQIKAFTDVLAWIKEAEQPEDDDGQD